MTLETYIVLRNLNWLIRILLPKGRNEEWNALKFNPIVRFFICNGTNRFQIKFDFISVNLLVWTISFVALSNCFSRLTQERSCRSKARHKVRSNIQSLCGCVSFRITVNGGTDSNSYWQLLFNNFLQVCYGWKLSEKFYIGSYNSSQMVCMKTLRLLFQLCSVWNKG